MGTGETIAPKRRPRKNSVSHLKPQRRNPLEGIEPLELEELVRPAPIEMWIEDGLFRRLLNAVVSYGLSIFATLGLATLVAWYVHERTQWEPVRVSGTKNGVVFAVGIGDPACRVIVETAPTSSTIAINTTPLLSKTPVKLLLPCNEATAISLTAPGFVSVAQIIHPKDQQMVRVTMNSGITPFMDEVKFHLLNGLQPIFKALGW